MRTLVLALFLTLPLAACIESQLDGVAGLDAAGADLPPVLPDMAWFDAPYRSGVGFHTLEEIDAKVEALAAARPDLARIEVVGVSREDRLLRALVITNRSLDGAKLAPFFDGGHHANELEGIESTLMLADYLLANYDRNATIRSYVDRFEIWILPLVNPDGYLLQTRGNALGVNLNRNYDVDWANPLGGTNPPMGVVSGLTGVPVRSVGGPFGENPGTHAFSEPEARAVRDVLAMLDGRLAFYASHHTAMPSILMPWAAFAPPFPVPAEEQVVFDDLVAWADANTVFRAGPGRWGETKSGGFYSASGTSQDWAYATHRVPSVTIEVAGCGTVSPGDPRFDEDNVRCEIEGGGSLAFWVQATLQVQMKLLANADGLHQWESPAAPPVLPDNVPPEAPYT